MTNTRRGALYGYPNITYEKGYPQGDTPTEKP